MKAQAPVDCLRRIRFSSCVLLLAAGGCAVLLTELAASQPAATTAPGAAIGEPVRVGRLTHPGLRESSGIVASRTHPGVYWTMNDSGNAPRLYAVDAAGKSLGVATVEAASNRDWEDIAADAAGRLYVADVGDNARMRRVLTIYAVPEPPPRGISRVKAERAWRFQYPKGHGPHDCEAMFVRGGWAYLITKEREAGRVYRVRLDAPAGQIVEAEYLGGLPGASNVTGADITPDGRHIAAVSYLHVYVYDLPAPLEKLAPPATPQAAGTAQAASVRPRVRRVGLGQAEGICWAAGRAGELLITNEARDVFRARAPLGTATAPASTSKP